jgi:hypothetical protein
MNNDDIPIEMPEFQIVVANLTLNVKNRDILNF